MLVVIIFGASGDLSKRKTYPALFALYRNKLLPDEFRIYGYSRTQMSREELHERLLPFLKKGLYSQSDKALLEKFLERCEYVHGPYDRPEGFQNLREQISSLPESETGQFNDVRLYYLALPPSVFVPISRQIKEVLYDPSCINRLVVEKPFGRDLQTSNKLSSALAKLFEEGEIFRIDHYLGKEMVKNILTLRFANIFFNSLWNRQQIANVQIVFKETLGVEGRGGYFDEYGIIRDVMQNHLLQMLAVIAMERPASLDAEDVRDEKVKVLRCIKPLTMDDVILGQYTRSADGLKGGYLDDETIAPNSNTATFAMATMYINNERWAGVPFVLRCGKALNEQKTEVRIQFNDVPGSIFPNCSRNELVIRVQPNESIYVKMMVKRPGLESAPIVSDLNLSYSSRYVDLKIPEAYESLLLDALRGDRSNFVRVDELEHAWKIFTPILHEVESKHIRPLEYPYGSRGPSKADDKLKKLGFIRSEQQYYSWPTQQL